MKELEEVKKILSDDEEIKESFKPNKKRFVLVNIIASLIIFILFFGGIFTVGILGLLDIIKFTNEAGERDTAGPIMFLVFSAPFFLISLLSITNNRLIIRSGFIGVDYKSIELKYVGLVNVRVDFLDKICGGNTGTITFGSPAIPMNGQNNSNGAFCFKCVDNPYEVYKIVKGYVSNN